MTDVAVRDVNRMEEVLEHAISLAFPPSTQRLFAAWREFGFDEKSLAKRAATMATHLADFVSEMAKEEEIMVAKTKKNVQEFTNQITTMSSELGMTPRWPPDEASVFQLKNLLPVEVKRLKEEKNRRLERQWSLLGQESSLLHRLGLPPRRDETLDESSLVPTPKELEDLEERVGELKERVENRETRFETSRRKILDILAEVGSLPGAFPAKLPDEESAPPDENLALLLNEDKKAVSLADEVLEQLERYIDHLESVRHARRSTISRLDRRLQDLWRRLGRDEEELTTFLTENRGCRDAVIFNYRNQVENLEEERLANLDRFTSKIRDDIRDHWIKCYLNEEQNEFHQIHDLNITESLLDAHETEMARLRSYYDQRLPLFVALEGWDHLWEQFIEFDRRANDPNRFSRRGAGLLQEEKERKKFSLKFPKMEKELEEEISRWEEENGEKFLILGGNFREFVEIRKKEWEIEKEQEKQERVRQRGTKGDVTHGGKSKAETPTKRRMGPEKSKGSQVRQQNKRAKGDDLKIPRSATFTRSPGSSNSNLQLINVDLPSPSSPAATPNDPPTRLLPTTPAAEAAAKKMKPPPTPGHRRILSAANSDDAINGNYAVSYECFSDGVRPEHRSSSLTDLRNPAASGARDAQYLHDAAAVTAPLVPFGAAFNESNF